LTRHASYAEVGLIPTGAIVAGYRIDGILGRGGMGVVYEATQLSLDRKVALKLIAPDMGADDALQERFRREGLRQAAIDHPHIVTVHESGETEQGLFFAMRLVRGPTLKEMVMMGELDAVRTVRILSQIADALDTAHEAGLIHRDVKPQNILVGIRDHAYLADFGLTKGVGDRSITQAGGFVGTLDYVAPEQIRGERTTPRTDVYALAAVLYECLTGVVPYPKDSQAATLWAHLALTPPRVSDMRPDLPAALDAVIARAMAKQPEARFATAGEMLRDAQGSLGRSWTAGTALEGPVASEEPIARHRRAAGVDMSTVGAGVSAEGKPSVPGLFPTVADAPPRAEPPFALRPADRARMPRAAIAVAVILLAGAIGGYASGASRGEGERATRPLVAGSLRLEVPSDWERSTSVPELPGLELSAAAGASRDRSSARGPSLLVGMADGGGATLLPSAFLDRLSRQPRPDDVVALGKLAGYRYRGLRPRGLDRPLTVLVVPTQKQVATIVCLGSRTTGPAAECERAAATLELDGVRGLSLGARKEYATALNAAIGELNTRRVRGRGALRAAATPSARANAARGLSRAFDQADRELGDVTAGPGERAAHEALREDARAAAAAYSRLASAARRESVSAFGVAAASIRKREAGIDRDLRALERLGYAVR